MKKNLLIVCIFLLSAFFAFAGEFSAQVNCGYGFISGTRYETTEENAHNIKAEGIEVGTVLAYKMDKTGTGWGVEAYFDYLFALKGSWDKVSAPRPAEIPEDMKYTDYKAGIGARYEFSFTQKDKLKLSAGINFAGVSNHTYEQNPKVIANQIEGRKVTSFGFYADAGIMHNIGNRFAVTGGVHICANPFGFIRNFDSASLRWVNCFDIASKTKCLTCFAQMGLVYAFQI